MNIVERSSGFWVVDALGVVNTEPFDTHQQARKWINRRIKVHQVSPRNPNMKGVYECVNPKQRIKGKYRRLKNGEILRKGDYSAFSRINEYPTGEWLLVKLRKTPMVVNYIMMI